MPNALRIIRRQPHDDAVEQIVGPLTPRVDVHRSDSGSLLTVSKVSPFGGESGLHDVTIPLDEVVSIEVVEFVPEGGE